MRSVEVYRNGVLAGQLIEKNTGSYTFRYDSRYLADTQQPAVSLTLPKTQEEFHAAHLFPFFSNMLSEGVNRKLQCRAFKIDENDDFGLLSATAQVDTIGAVTVKPVNS
jgi:HipA-like protein